MTVKTPKPPAIEVNGRFVSVTDTAKLIRYSLACAFPGQKFSVRSDSYAGGASIRIRYDQAKDSPRPGEVEKVVAPYVGSTFDGMIDLKSYVTALLTIPGEDMPREVHFGADHVFVDSDLTPEYAAELTAIAKARVKTCSQKEGGPQDWDDNPDAWLWLVVNGRVINDTNLAGAVRALGRMGVADPT